MNFSGDELEAIKAKALADPYYFVQRVLRLDLDWFHEAALRLGLTQPFSLFECWRGGGKTIIRTTGRALYEICRNPNTRGLILSETEEQATALLKGVRARLEVDPLLIAMFGQFAAGRGKWTDTKLEVAQRTVQYDEPTITAMGIGGAFTGRHYDWIILDDVFDVDSARSETLREILLGLIRSKISPCLMPGGWVQMNDTRYHYHDAAGYIAREFAVDKATGESFVYRLEHPDDMAEMFESMPRNARWKVLQIPAIRRDGQATCEARFPLEDRVEPDGRIVRGLTSIRGDLGERAFNEQFMMVCDEATKGEEETEFKRAWYREWTTAPDLRRLDCYLRVDPAFRDREQAAKRTKRERDPDYYALGLVGFDRAHGRAYVLDAFRDRCTPIEREQRGKEMADRWVRAGASIRMIEVERTGLQMVEAPEFYARVLKALRPHRARFGHPAREGNKVARAQPLARGMESGTVEWSPAIRATYPAIVDWLAAFPFGAHDDLEDAISAAYLMGERRPRSLAAHARQKADGREEAGRSDAAVAEVARRTGRSGARSSWADRVKGAGAVASSGGRSWADRVKGAAR